MSVHDRWKGARKGDGRRWEVRWREGGRQCKRRFDSRQAAEAFEAKRRLEPEQRLAAEGRSLTVDRLVETWLSTKRGLRPKSRDACVADAREIVQAFGGRLAGSVKPSEVRVWSARERSASMRRRSMTAMRQAYGLAVADGILPADPTKRLPLPRVDQAEMRFLSWHELRALADAAGKHGPLVWVLGTCGLRLGEALGLNGEDVNRDRRRLQIRRSYSDSSEGLELGPTKGKQTRDVPVMTFVLNMLPERTGPQFVGARGGRLNPATFRIGAFQRAAAAVGLGEIRREVVNGRKRRSYVGMHPHELRHTAASLAIDSGANVKVVQRMLGHKSAKMTLDLYGHLWDDRLDSVAVQMDAAQAAAFPTLQLPSSDVG